MSCLARWGSTVAAASVPGPGPPARPGSRWWLADRPPPAGSHDRPASRRERACAPCRWAGPCRGPSARSGSGPWPSARSYRRPVPMKTSMSSVFIFVPPLVAWVRGQPVDDRSRTHACERPHTQRVVPLIGSHQRPAAAGDFRPPRIIYGQAQDNRAHSSWPGPGPPRTTNKVTGRSEPSKRPRATWRRFVYPAPMPAGSTGATENVVTTGRKVVIFQFQDDHSRLAVALPGRLERDQPGSHRRLRQRRSRPRCAPTATWPTTAWPWAPAEGGIPDAWWSTCTP